MVAAHKNLLVLALAGALGGCGGVPDLLPSKDNIPFVHRIDVQQGNVVTQEMLARLEPGMEKSKVRFIMGTPLLVDTFHSDRWDYVYSYQEDGGEREQRRVSVHFDDKDRLVGVSGNVKAAPGKLVVDREPSAMIEVPGERKRSFFSKVKDKAIFWGDDEPVPTLPEEGTDETDDTGSAETDAGKPEGEERAEAAAAGEEPQPSGESLAAREEVVIPEDAPTRKKEKGFFARLLEKVGIGDDEPSREQEATERVHRDPTNPDDGSGPLR